MPSYKIKDPSPISSEKVLILLEAIKHLEEKLKSILNECSHSFEATEESWYDDSWSKLDAEVENTLHCKICGHIEYGHKTGRIVKCY